MRTHQGRGQGEVAETQPESKPCSQWGLCLMSLLPIAVSLLNLTD